MKEKIFVTVPFYNEEKLLGTLVAAFKRQTDQDFHVVYVNNNSVDTSVEVLTREHKGTLFTYEIIDEKEKGTGCASDAGFRHAITKLNAKYLARTDADCLPDDHWIKIIRENLIDGQLDFIAGTIKPRKDDIPLSFFNNVLIHVMVFVAELYGKFKFGVRGYKYIFFMVAGNNLAITREMYHASGGFPRTSIDTTDEDLVLAQSVRKLTTKAKKCKNMVVYNSIRRVKAYGHWNILMWYKDRAYKPDSPDLVDIR